MSGRHPPLCCNLTLIAMQGHQTTKSNKNVVCFLPIYYGRQVRRMYQPGSHRGKVTQDFSSTILLRRMPLFASLEGFIRSFPSSTVKLHFCVLTVSSFSTCWAFSSTFRATYAFIFILFLSREESSRFLPSSTLNSSSPLVGNF